MVQQLGLKRRSLHQPTRLQRGQTTAKSYTSDHSAGSSEMIALWLSKSITLAIQAKVGALERSPPARSTSNDTMLPLVYDTASAFLQKHPGDLLLPLILRKTPVQYNIESLPDTAMTSREAA
jgi:hypothetical protein